MGESLKQTGTGIHLFRNDLRLHDMPSLSTILEVCSTLYPVYIFEDDDIQTQKIGYNRMRFILDALKDIDDKLHKVNGRLYVFQGKGIAILSDLFKRWNVTHLSYECDVQPVWVETENNIKQICAESNIEIIKKVSHTLWDTEAIVKANGGSPPVTYSIFNHVIGVLGLPEKPQSEVNFNEVIIPDDEKLDSKLLAKPEEFGINMECAEQINKIWIGGEIRALEHLEERLKIEKIAFSSGYFMPNQINPDLLGPPMSMSAALSNGCLSVRRFYWSLSDLYKSVNSDSCLPDGLLPDGLMGQLIWREYFYAMCMNNAHYSSMLDNPICLNIPWATNPSMLECWTDGKTGFPFIDAAMRQLRQEGWIHHVARNAVACFLTRGDLWISWEEGLKVFMKYLIDGDAPVCAGNWMWVSSSAFENVLQCPSCISPILYGRRFEPSGKYIRKYVPELKNMPHQFLFEPWLAPLSVQEVANCIIGKDYPFPIVNHQQASKRNADMMTAIKESFLPKSVPLHCAPSNSAETRVFMWLPEKCVENLLTCDN
ncbi:cryptochrome-1-like isoform X2 [Stegodyphus dumicola]|nr:cryptochrome-1-like isoform X2 [Stegodyphus dumicola]XP_035216342.1 cryptochrome-1-like isoform X2 [Stegodyphus dumicola]XP_035216343.1 cryptochrome-1-like isoform X2 [Stegodyphus dumicola]